MWRLLHKLFGWHYVAIKFGHSDSIARVRNYPNGERFIIVCGYQYFLNDDGTTKNGAFDQQKYTALTWKIGEK